MPLPTRSETNEDHQFSSRCSTSPGAQESHRPSRTHGTARTETRESVFHGGTSPRSLLGISSDWSGARAVLKAAASSASNVGNVPLHTNSSHVFFSSSKIHRNPSSGRPDALATVSRRAISHARNWRTCGSAGICAVWASKRRSGSLLASTVGRDQRVSPLFWVVRRWLSGGGVGFVRGARSRSLPISRNDPVPKWSPSSCAPAAHYRTSSLTTPGATI